MKIMTWNVNAFAGNNNWNTLKKQKKLKEVQNQYFQEVVNYINKKIIEDGMDIIILEEIPYKRFSEQFMNGIQKGYKVFFPIEVPRGAVISTAIIAKDPEWSHSQAIFREKLNRIVAVSNGKKKVVGVHLPTVDIKDTEEDILFDDKAKRLWEELIQYCRRNEDVVAIAGDYNTDYEGFTQYAKMYDLCKLGYHEANGDATRLGEGNPTTTQFGPHHDDYILVREGCEVSEYRIDNDIKQLSDHYPLIASIQDV